MVGVTLCMELRPRNSTSCARRDWKRHRCFIAVENSRNPVEIHLVIFRVAKIADILERAAILWRLQ